MIDTHSHIYAEEFDTDRNEAVQRAKAAGVEHIILPNVDVDSIERLHETERIYTGYCHAAMGLHPTSVNHDYTQALAVIGEQLKKRPYAAIGEIGIDLYWDKTFFEQQVLVFEQQLEWSLQYGYPVIIHMRDSFNEVMTSIRKFKNLMGIFHSFSGTVEQAGEILQAGDFKLGINGVVTFKNSGLDKAVAQLGIENLVLETDAPYLTPVPYRGKRNETAYVELVCRKLAEICGLSFKEVEEMTDKNAKYVFKHIFKA